MPVNVQVVTVFSLHVVISVFDTSDYAGYHCTVADIPVFSSSAPHIQKFPGKIICPATNLIFVVFQCPEKLFISLLPVAYSPGNFCPASLPLGILERIVPFFLFQQTFAMTPSMSPFIHQTIKSVCDRCFVGIADRIHINDSARQIYGNSLTLALIVSNLT